MAEAGTPTTPEDFETVIDNVVHCNDVLLVSLMGSEKALKRCKKAPEPLSEKETGEAIQQLTRFRLNLLGALYDDTATIQEQALATSLNVIQASLRRENEILTELLKTEQSSSSVLQRLSPRLPRSPRSPRRGN